MSKNRKKKHNNKIGKSPGSVIYTGTKSSKELFIDVFDYTIEKCIEKELKNIEETFQYKKTDSITWINLNGLNHVNEIEKLGVHYDIHPLVLEDIVSISQRPKIDEYEDYIFVVLKMLYLNKDENILFTSSVTAIVK